MGRQICRSRAEKVKGVTGGQICRSRAEKVRWVGKFAGVVYTRWVRVAPVGGCGWHRRPGRGQVWARAPAPRRAPACVRRRAPACAGVRRRMRACAHARMCAGVRTPGRAALFSSHVAPLYSGARGRSPGEAEPPTAPRWQKQSRCKGILKSYLTLRGRVRGHGRGCMCSKGSRYVHGQWPCIKGAMGRQICRSRAEKV